MVHVPLTFKITAPLRYSQHSQSLPPYVRTLEEGEEGTEVLLLWTPILLLGLQPGEGLVGVVCSSSELDAAS